MIHVLERPAEAFAWELRAAWASQKRVTLTLDPEIAELTVDRIRGTVEHVSSTGLFVIMLDGLGEIHVPLAAVLSIRSPHFTEPADEESAEDDPLEQERLI